MATERMNTLESTARRGLAIYFGTLNLVGETVSDPGRALRNIQRRGERVLTNMENNNRQVRRSLTLLRRRGSETAQSLERTAMAGVGVVADVAGDVEATTPSARRSTSTRSRTSASTRTAGRSSASSRTGRATTSRSRSEAARKAARTRALHERQAQAKKAAANAKRRATRAAHESETAIDRAADRVQKTAERVADRVGDAVESITS